MTAGLQWKKVRRYPQFLVCPQFPTFPETEVCSPPHTVGTAHSKTAQTYILAIVILLFHLCESSDLFSDLSPLWPVFLAACFNHFFELKVNI